MKRYRLLFLFLFAGSVAVADDVFPGLQKVMSEAEWKRAGLDRLTADQIGVIDAALIRHYHQTVAAALADPANGSAVGAPAPAPGATPAEAAAARSRFWEHFGWGKASGPDWRSQPPMIAKVTAWRGANGFVLDNGQVWEGLEKIPFDLPGNTVTIEARPLDSFALKLNDNSASVRVRRVK